MLTTESLKACSPIIEQIGCQLSNNVSRIFCLYQADGNEHHEASLFFVSPTMTVRRSSETFESESDDISFESQCRRFSFEEIHCSLHVLAIVCKIWRHDLSTAEYDVETLDISPPASVIRAAVYAACCAHLRSCS